MEEPMLVAIVLEFDRTSVSFAVGADDSINTVDSRPLETDQDYRVSDISGLSPWDESIGLPLLWSWTLTNQQGYNDGVQFDFAQDGGSRSVLIQILGLAGEVKVRRMSSQFMTVSSNLPQGCSN